MVRQKTIFFTISSGCLNQNLAILLSVHATYFPAYFRVDDCIQLQIIYACAPFSLLRSVFAPLNPYHQLRTPLPQTLCKHTFCPAHSKFSDFAHSPAPAHDHPACAPLPAASASVSCGVWNRYGYPLGYWAARRCRGRFVPSGGTIGQSNSEDTQTEAARKEKSRTKYFHLQTSDS